MNMITGSFYIPKDNKSKPHGDDAHFICVEERVLGVADGVGGWAKQRVDAGKYARELMANAVIAIRKQRKGHVNLERVLKEAYLNTKAKGSSTACLIKLTDQFLRCVNIGDSGFILVRKGRVIFSTPVQQHCFNYPFQLGSNDQSDRPSKAQVFKVAVFPGDVIVAGTDGLFDNLFKHEIAENVACGVLNNLEPEAVAITLVERALHRSCNERSLTPFAKTAKKAGIEHHGGKIDDITVIVAYIV